MTKKFMRIPAILLAGMFFFSCSSPAQENDVSADDFQSHLSSPGAQILDVRTTGEYNNGHIQNALLADWKNKDQFEDRVQYLDKTKPVLVYCASGGRSGQAAKWLSDNGFVHVENLKGGFIEWNLEKKPVETPSVAPQLNITEYISLVNGDKPVLVDFGAAWCPPCKKMQSTIDALQNEANGKFKVVTIDGGINTDLMQQLSISGLPTFIVYKDGKEVWRKQGIVEKAELIRELDK